MYAYTADAALPAHSGIYSPWICSPNQKSIQMIPILILWLNEPCHEIMVLFIFCKLILQMHMGSHPVGLDIRFLVGHFICFHTSCVRTAMVLARRYEYAGLPEPSLVACVLSTIISWAGSNKIHKGKEELGTILSFNGTLLNLHCYIPNKSLL